MHRRVFLKEAVAGFATASLITVTPHASAHAPAPGWQSPAMVPTDFAAELRPAKRARPLVAIVADNRGTELTDCLVPQAVLSRSHVADVVLVAPAEGEIALMPALSVKAQQTLASFDGCHPEGADHVIVPAMHHDEHSGPIVEWLRRQAALGATIFGVCEGARVLGRAGLLDGRRATSHWYALPALRSRHPSMQWVPDRRYVADRGVVTTTGVTASLPVSLALVEAIAGAAVAGNLARELGAAGYGSAHDSARYRLDVSSVWRVAANSLALWRHETVGIAVSDGVDGIALAFTADAWARTYRSKAVAVSDAARVATSDGVEILGCRGHEVPDVLMHLDRAMGPAPHLDKALADIARRYGEDTARLVALQLEYAG